MLNNIPWSWKLFLSLYLIRHIRSSTENRGCFERDFPFFWKIWKASNLSRFFIIPLSTRSALANSLAAGSINRMVRLLALQQFWWLWLAWPGFLPLFPVGFSPPLWWESLSYREEVAWLGSGASCYMESNLPWRLSLRNVRVTLSKQCHFIDKSF